MTGDDIARWLIIGAAVVVALVAAACLPCLIREKRDMARLRADMDAWNRGVRP